MAYIVTEPCVKCKYTDCVEVCPVDCFHEDDEMLVINPDTCIDCGACVPTCPVEAIFEEKAVPAKWKPYIKLNEVRSRERPILDEKKEPWTEN